MDSHNCRGSESDYMRFMESKEGADWIMGEKRRKVEEGERERK